MILAYQVLGLSNWNLSIPLGYNHGDATWQLNLTKTLLDTGWILNNPYLGAPGVAHWYINAAAQTSALHSLLMLALSPFIHDAVRLQQTYYLLNFPLICLTSFVACRLLGIARLPAFATGLLYAFTTFRFDNILYSFLSNYFIVPLALVPVIWILNGRFAMLFDESDVSAGRWERLRRVLRSREFILGLVFVLLTAVTDGYYAFFTLLLLGFAAFSRAVIGDWRRPLVLIPAGVFIVALLGAALALQWPLHQYKETHHSEFYPNGVKDPALFKHPFEAEVYSSSLKMLIAPISEHRISSMAALGKLVIGTSDAALIFKHGRAAVPLGTLGSLLLTVALVLLAIPAARRAILQRTTSTNGRQDPTAASNSLPDTLLSLTLFIFLCSTFGGIGSLVALVFPTIRDYERFPIFLIFVLFLGGAWFMTQRLRDASGPGRLAWAVFLFLVTAGALYDQIPRDAKKGSAAIKTQFLAEGRFVQKVEAVLPPDAMVYQFPYSQYLRDSKYYGWGSFAGVRLYLHSHDLRWNNGGDKNSPADDWNFRISQLPLDKLIAEVEAVGFSGFVIDHTVVNSIEYQSMRQTFTSRGYEMLEDAPSKLTFVRLQDPGFKLVYDPTYREADHIVVTDPVRLLAQSDFPELINDKALRRFVIHEASKANYVIRKAEHPDIFVDGSTITRGLGQTPIVPISDMRGQMDCKVEAGPEADGASDMLLLTVENQSHFDWKLGDGPFPIRIGVHINQADGKLLRWDDGFRVPTDAYIRRGDSRTIRLPINTLPPSAKLGGSGPLVAQFALVQDGNAWFGNVSCTVPLR
ncbi:MAG TPA: hypothetical protein VMV97_02895 [Sulfuriferula sp.]|nr:hypothetical protein [Sulfuriferula sp.]